MELNNLNNNNTTSINSNGSGIDGTGQPPGGKSVLSLFETIRQQQPSLPPINAQFIQALYSGNPSVSTSPTAGPPNFTTSMSNKSSPVAVSSSSPAAAMGVGGLTSENGNSMIGGRSSRSSSNSAGGYTDRKMDGLTLPPLNFTQQKQQQQHQPSPVGLSANIKVESLNDIVVTPVTATSPPNINTASNTTTASTATVVLTTSSTTTTAVLSGSKKRGSNKRTAAAAGGASSNAGHSTVAKKRRSLSCQTCRKLKTRCDFDASRGMCHRCFVLRLSCSLAVDQVQQPNYLTKVNLEPAPADQQASSVSASASNGNSCFNTKSTFTNKDDSILARLEVLENAISGIGEQLQSLKDLLGEKPVMATAAIAKSNFMLQPSPAAALETLVLDKNVGQSPLSVIWDIDYKLFDRSEKYATMRAASIEMDTWINAYIDPALEQRLKDSFYTRCQCYIIPNTAIAAPELSPLMRGVLLLQGMRCDETATYDGLQPQLFTIVRSLTGTAMMTAPLQLSDIESLLYMAMFNIARKPRQPIFDSWLLSSHAVRLFILSVRFHDMARRGARSQLTPEDKYNLRVWNGICLVHYQYAVLTDRPVAIPEEYLAVGELLAGVTEFDTRTLAEIKLYQVAVAAKATGDISRLRRWYTQHGAASSSSTLSPDLRLSYDLCVIILEPPARQIEASIRVLNLLLLLPRERIAGMPNHPLIIIIYAAMTLCRHLPTTTEVGEHLTLIVRSYWYLAQIGKQSRDIVDSIARIIKSVIMATRKADGAEILNQFVSAKEHEQPNPSPLPQQQQNEELPDDTLNESVLDMLDLSQYSSFDDFFDGVFNYFHNHTDLISA
jgi:hypothetical protein